MTEYTQEELDKIVAEKVSQAQNRQYIADNGVIAFTMSMEYLNDQANRNIIPKSVVDIMGQIYATFRVDIGLDAPKQQADPDKEKPD